MKNSEHFPAAFYRVAVRGLMQEENKFLLARRRDDGIWETFGGGLDFGESPHEALQREIFEETGCEVKSISKKPILALPHIVHGKRGMDWFYNFPIYYQIELDITKIDFSLQFSEVAWFTLDEIKVLPLFEGEEGLRNGLTILL